MQIGEFRIEAGWDGMGWDECPLKSMTLLIDRSLVTMARTQALH